MTAAEMAARCDPRARQSGTGWVARCPAHPDHNPSLSVGAGRDGRVLVHCWAGCATADVLAAAGLRWADVCGGPRRRLTRRELAESQRQQRQVRRQHDRLLAEARTIADRCRTLGRLEIAALDRLRDIQAGAPERTRGEAEFAAWAAADAAAEIVRLAAEHDRLLDMLHPRRGRAEARPEVAA